MAKLGTYEYRGECRINVLIYHGDGASLKKNPPPTVLVFCSWDKLYTERILGRNYSWELNAPVHRYYLEKLFCVNVSHGGRAYRLPKLAAPIHWINPSYLLIKSSNHGLDPFHWFVSRHGRAEGHRNAALVNPRRETGADKLIYTWKCVPKRWERTRGASIFPFL